MFEQQHKQSTNGLTPNSTSHIRPVMAPGSRRLGCLSFLSVVFAASGASAQLLTYGRQDVLATFTNASATAELNGSPMATPISSGTFSAWTDSPLCHPTPQAPCAFNVNSIRMNVAPFAVGSVQVTEMTIWTWQPIGGLQDDGTGASVGNAPFAVSFLVDGRPNSIKLTPQQSFKIYFEPSAESVVLSGVLSGSRAGTNIVISFLAAANRPLRNRPPLVGGPAVVSVTADCLSPAYVDASAVSDPNGNLAQVYVAKNGSAIAAGTGNIGPIRLPTGEHDLELVAVDSYGAQASKPVHLVVKDTGVTPNVVGTNKVQFVVPVGKTISDFGVLATSAITVGDRSRIVGNSNQGVQIANLGTGTVDCGVSTVVGSVTANGPVSLRSNAVVEGDVRTAKNVTLQPNARITGARLEFANNPKATDLSWNLFVPSAPRPQALFVDSDTTRVLVPGTYGAVTVQPRATLVLGDGIYDLTSLTAESQSKIQLSASGPTTIILQSGFTFRGTFVSLAHASKMLTVYRGTSDASVEMPWPGTILAQNSLLRIGALVPSSYTGAYIASRLEVRPDTTLNVVPFDWKSIRRARSACVLQPVAECKHVVGGTTYARFGYINQLTEGGVGLLAGLFNRTDASVPGLQLPRAFRPGQVHGAVELPLTGSSVSWVLGHRFATATGSLPTCP